MCRHVPHGRDALRVRVFAHCRCLRRGSRHGETLEESVRKVLSFVLNRRLTMGCSCSAAQPPPHQPESEFELSAFRRGGREAVLTPSRAHREKVRTPVATPAASTNLQSDAQSNPSNPLTSSPTVSYRAPRVDDLLSPWRPISPQPTNLEEPAL